MQQLESRGGKGTVLPPKRDTFSGDILAHLGFGSMKAPPGEPEESSERRRRLQVPKVLIRAVVSDYPVSERAQAERIFEDILLEPDVNALFIYQLQMAMRRQNVTPPYGLVISPPTANPTPGPTKAPLPVPTPAPTRTPDPLPPAWVFTLVVLGTILAIALCMYAARILRHRYNDKDKDSRDKGYHGKDDDNEDYGDSDYGDDYSNGSAARYSAATPVHKQDIEKALQN
jgi:hypothetical protein